ncbi:hypothetical protein [Bradyrhizobium canariense]|uniref:Uncharacterized protein n=1 Tax=Bradyrhizobium canariense TaxID=255045 RepID=A0A1X3GU67_9BRAD|nr:hypothetical protein [Bradyrhizobium canariense]OSI80347.1 hypothetical protein BSZ22_01005 [Bradyrhizobium canariense]OSI82508.1 hypothetical protein BSZ23_01210 [Bradyrhizobium canariense]OSI96967.1 hypothetical protein BSZ25_01005 [Bradyrhizobium canariense]OSI99288.1 hypothetical protein BSZ24_00640 [Bradyrhizobium canariense]OSJ16626.1 hypothetical protein BSZ16_00970 [Bradyrhizobium canariense]
MNKTTLHIERPQERQVRRADLAPSTGYAIVVDGRLKTEFVDENAATKAAVELLAKYPMLRIEVYDAASKSRKLVRLAAPASQHAC